MENGLSTYNEFISNHIINYILMLIKWWLISCSYSSMCKYIMILSNLCEDLQIYELFYCLYLVARVYMVFINTSLGLLYESIYNK